MIRFSKSSLVKVGQGEKWKESVMSVASKRITFAPNFCNLLKQNPKLYVVTGEEIFHFLFKQHKTHGSRASMIFVFQSIHVFSLAPCNSYIDLTGCCD